MVRITEVVPKKLLSVGPCLGDHVLVAVAYSLFDRRWRKLVDGIAGDDGITPCGRLGVEAGGTVAAAKNGSSEVCIRQGEQAPVLLERPAPGDDLIELKGHVAGLLRAAPLWTPAA